MKKRILCLILTVIMLVGMCAAFTSCDDPEECTHVDENNDKKCDLCDEAVKGLHKHKDEDGDKKCDGCGRDLSDDKQEEVIVYPWADNEPVTLIFQMTHNSNVLELSSECSRYLAGGADDDQYVAKDQDIDTMVLERNEAALDATNVHVRYQYWDDIPTYGHGKCADHIFTNTQSNATGDVPDMYCNFSYDMVYASVKGSFSNLRSTQHNYDGANFFAFNDPDYNELVDNEGFMYDYMCSTTLNYDKMYILASDYFTDLIRAFFIVPVNKALLESVGSDITGDLDGDGTFTIEDFYQEVKQKKWTYNKVIEYSAAIYQAGDGNTGGESINDRLGFAISSGGVACSGLLYSTNITVINKEPNDAGGFTYTYPAESPEIIEMFTNAKTLVESKGVYVAGAYSATDAQKKEEAVHGTKHLLAIRKRFCESMILFGDIMMVGALEYDSYQALNDEGADGFGVVPVPLYHEVAMDDPENYLTSIHNVGRSGAIAANTRKFAECTAFLNYQSTHSTEILNEYYDYNLQYGATDGSKGTVEMLQYIRLNVRSAFDKTFEDVIKVRFDAEYDAKGITPSWSSHLTVNDYALGAEFANVYDSLVESKQKNLDALLTEYDILPS